MGSGLCLGGRGMCLGVSVSAVWGGGIGIGIETETGTGGDEGEGEGVNAAKGRLMLGIRNRLW